MRKIDKQLRSVGILVMIVYGCLIVLELALILPNWRALGFGDVVGPKQWLILLHPFALFACGYMLFKKFSKN